MTSFTKSMIVISSSCHRHGNNSSTLLQQIIRRRQRCHDVGMISTIVPVSLLSSSSSSSFIISNTTTVLPTCRKYDSVFFIEQQLKQQQLPFSHRHFHTSKIIKQQEQQQKQQQQQQTTTDNNNNNNSKEKKKMSDIVISTVEIEKLIIGSLRTIIRPFLLKCHPDVVSRNESYKKLNLIATQNLNSYLDRIQLIITKKHDPSNNTNTNNNTSNNTIELDFVVPVVNNTRSMTKKQRKNLMIESMDGSSSSGTASTDTTDNLHTIWSRRKVLMTMPKMTDYNWNDDMSIVRYNLFQIRNKVRTDLYNLLKIASLPIPSIQTNEEQKLDKIEQQEIKKYRIIHGKSNDKQQNRTSNINSATATATAAFNRRVPLTQYERNRKKFWGLVDKNRTKLDKLYKETMLKFEATQATSGLIANDYKRRQLFIAKLLSYIQIHKPITIQQQQQQQPVQPVQSEENTTNDTTTTTTSTSTYSNENDTETIQYEEITEVEKFIAIRRLSLLFDDELFEELLVEQYGRYWESGAIYFTLMPIELTRSNNGGSITTKLKTKKKKKSIYDNDGIIFVHDPILSTVSIQIPINFRDEAIRNELLNSIIDIYQIVTQPIINPAGSANLDDETNEDKEFEKMINLPMFF